MIPPFLRNLSWKIVAIVAAVILLLGFLQLRSCINGKQEAAQARVDQGQDDATLNSARDAISTQGNVAANALSSEETTARNREEIRNAQGSADAVNPAVRDAGFASLCKRASFRNSATGRLRCTSPGIVAPAR